jgi:hypothetical protein
VGVATSLNLPAWLLVFLLKVAFSWGEAKLDVMMVCLQTTTAVQHEQNIAMGLIGGSVRLA